MGKSNTKIVDANRTFAVGRTREHGSDDVLGEIQLSDDVTLGRQVRDQMDVHGATRVPAGEDRVETANAQFVGALRSV